MLYAAVLLFVCFCFTGDKKGKGKGRPKTFEQNKQQQEAQNALNASQAMKKDRETFRKALVDIIM